jgi:hypothetical protein
VAEQLYLLTLSRKPTSKEQEKLTSLASASPDKRAMLEDLFWSLLNSREFMFNH